MKTNGRIRINTPKVVHETIEGETVILNLDTGNYYSLRGVGAEIWDYIDRGSNMNDIMRTLYNTYDCGSDDIENSIHNFLSELIKENLTVSDEADTAGVPGMPDAEVKSAAKGQKISFTLPVLNKYTDMQDLLLLDPIHEVDETSGWPNVDDKKGWPTRNPDSPFKHE